MLSDYLISRKDRYVVSACVKNPILWKTVKPWWFDDQIATSLGWASFYHYKVNDWDPTLAELLNLVDSKKIKATSEEIDQYLAPNPVDTETLLLLFKYFKSYGMLIEPIFSHYSSNRKLNEEQFQTFKGLSNEFKSMDISNSDKSVLDAIFKKIKINYDRLQKDQRQLR